MERRHRNDMTRELDEKYGIIRTYTLFAFLCGMRFPSPLWFKNIPRLPQMLWLGMSYVMQYALVWLFVSNVMELLRRGHDEISVRTECSGTIVALIYSQYKVHLLAKFRHIFESVISRLFSICEELNNSSISYGRYLTLHKKHFGGVQKYCIFKFYFAISNMWLLNTAILIFGLLEEDSTKRKTTMEGYFPLDFSSRFQYFVASTVQIINYHTLLGRDMVIDITLLVVLGVINTQLIHLKELLADIIERTTDPKLQKKLMNWWIRQHQEIHRIVDEYKSISSPSLFITYGYISFILLMVLFRLIEDDEFIVEQQTVVIGVNMMNCVHLYVISVLGDEVANNSAKISEALKSGDLWKFGKSEREKALFVALRCSQPLYIRFGDNRIVSARSFGSIIKGLLSYFVTIYQIRNAEEE